VLALRNILQNNPENQAVVAAIKPMGTWDENGVLVDAPGAVRR
jgi:ataxin-10